VRLWNNNSWERFEFLTSETGEMTMANASKKHIGTAGSRGKGDGSGARTIETPGTRENMVLSNRDKKQHSKERGQDGNAIKTDQEQDHAANRRS
jgi:hypothetical protein